MNLRRLSSRRRGPAARQGDHGFSVVEVAVAMTLALLLSLGLMQVMLAGLKHVREARLAQQATQLALDGVEYARSLAWPALAVLPEVALDDPALIASGRRLAGATFGLAADEPLVEVSGGHVLGNVPYHTTETVDGVDFDIYSYVTEPQYGLRRVVVLVEWSLGNVARSQHTSALISAVSTR